MREQNIKIIQASPNAAEAVPINTSNSHNENGAYRNIVAESF